MKLFFSGIGGSGVSAIAGFMAEKGHTVAGSDRLFDLDPGNRICRNLRSKGIIISPQDGSGISSSCELAVFSTAVEKSNADFLKADKLGIPVMTRPAYLAMIVSEFRTVAVAGTSGKSTTSGMLAFLMERLGMCPNFIGGGRVKQFRTRENQGNYLSGESDLLVVEACESDGSIVDYLPVYSIISNLDLDHHSVSETALMFRKLADNTSDLVITGGDDRNLRSFNIGGTLSFSIEQSSKYQARDIVYHPLRTNFTVNGQQFELSLPGRHNLYNALACIAFLSEVGVKGWSIAGVLPGFSGIERRFDIHLNNGKTLVIDDYAHNPHKIANLMMTMQGISRKVCYIFQPHGFGPTRMMKDGYITTFSDNLRESDHLIILPIYYAGGTAAWDISSHDLADGITASGKSVRVIEDRKDLFSLSREWDSYVVFGARDDSLSDLASAIAKRLE